MDLKQDMKMWTGFIGLTIGFRDSCECGIEYSGSVKGVEFQQ
jgi:hypothetical protein